MRILNHNPCSIARIPYHNAAPGGGKTESVSLPVTTATVSGLPPDLHGILLSADLQGRERVRRLALHEEPPLLGETLAHDLQNLCRSAMLPPTHHLGVILAGDLWADPQSRKRGGLGEVAPVWNAFARSFRWVAGVLGNHDTYTGPSFGNQHLLDGTIQNLDGVSIGGVNGIIGHAGKPGRRPEADFLLQLYMVLDHKPDVVILHMGPDAPGSGLMGNEAIRRVLEEYPPTLVVCGHCHAEEPIHTLGNGTQVVNVDSRAVVLLPESPRWLMGSLAE